MNNLNLSFEIIKQLTCNKFDLNESNIINISTSHDVIYDEEDILEKQCFSNAYNTVSSDTNRFEYCLGYGLIQGFPIEHAFVFDKENNVYFDPTREKFSLDFNEYVLLKKYSSNELIADILDNHNYPPDVTLLVNKAIKQERKTTLEAKNQKTLSSTEKNTCFKIS